MRTHLGFTILAGLAFVANAGNFQWTDCTPAGGPLSISQIEVSPSPIVVPGDIQISVNGVSSKPLGSSALHVSLKRKTFLGEIGIPCLLNVGSCNYADICTIVDQMETENWAGIMGGIGTQIRTMLNHSDVDASRCPQPPQTLNIDHQSIHIPEIPAVLSFFAAGDYHAHISVTDNASNMEILCIDATLTIKEQCSGLSCLFG